MTFDELKDKTIPEMESETLKFWKENKVFEKSIEQRSNKDRYVFYDGPPFISGLPHYGGLLSSVIKDVVVRFWTMKGKKIERVWGWDAHGLTVENKVQQKLGIKNRRDIEAYGLEKFTNACYEYTSEISEAWKWYVDKIGRWVDMDNAYRTTDQSYMETVMWVFKQLYDKGLIYEGVRTSLFCTTCGTPVSNFEIAMDNSYKDMEDPSIVVEFPIISDGEFKGMRALAWTTTPWTIPSNRALVVDPSEDYVAVSIAAAKSKEPFILAEKRLSILGSKEYKIVKRFKGQNLVGLQYDPPFTFYNSNENDLKIYSFENMVTMEEGTGIVHSAPGFGEIDTQMGNHYGLTIMLSIDDEGKFVAGNLSENPYTGVYYAKANPLIRVALSEQGLLFSDETIVHRFPYHDRCNTPLIQKAQKSWFIDIQSLKKDLVRNNQEVNWIPEHIKHGRFENSVEQAPDWCISRNRFWATPMPIWESEDGDRIVVSSIKEIEDLSGQKVKDLHRPFIDEITIEKNGKTYRRRTEVLDCWLESGSMPYAQFHYPFENKEKFESNFPGDFVAEYTGQIRAWFYVMHVLATALFDKPAFRNVVVTGVMAGNDGRKMSKSYGNYTDPKEVFETIGGDAVRQYLMNSPLMLAGDTNFDEEQLKVKLRNVLNPFWNSLKFFKIYEQSFGWTQHNMVSSKNVLDMWIKTRLNETIKIFSENMEKYVIPPAMQAVEDFVDDLSRWYVRRSRERIASGDNEALSTLYFVLLNFAKASAPIIPFMAEEVYRSLSDGKLSVHLCDYPTFDQDIINTNQEVLAKMKVTRDIVALALSIRTENTLKVRQPLPSLTTNKADYYAELIEDEVNVKEVFYDKDQAELVVLDMKITPDLIKEGTAREMIRKLQDLRKKQGLSVEDKITATYEDTKENVDAIKQFGDFIKQKVIAESLDPGSAYEVKKL
ncbi:MAG: isoleucine--tRNA ligase [Patescibacteria group bacterium]|jgi:isoleucyl-tRNA synthetase